MCGIVVAMLSPEAAGFVRQGYYFRAEKQS
jgi:hypothetical protein